MDIVFGALAPKLTEQLKGRLTEEVLVRYDKDADAITRLLIRGLIPDSVAHKARIKLVKMIGKSAKE